MCKRNNWVMSGSFFEEHELRIQEKYIHLVTTMTHVDEMTVEMHRDQKLTDQEKDSIDQFQSIPIRAKEELLNVVMKKPKDVYDAFLSALNNTNQQHIVQMLVSEAVGMFKYNRIGNAI